MQSEIDLAQSITSLIEETDEESFTLLDVVKKAVPELTKESIKSYFSYIVNGKATKDWETKVSKDDDIKVVPLFAGGQ